MATKPTSTPRWASDGAADVIEPPSGKKDTGWLVDDKPPAQWENWLRKITWQWTEYVGDGVWEAVSATFSGAIEAASVTIGSAIAAASAAITGDVAIGGDLTLTGEDYHGDRTEQLPVIAGRAQSGVWTRTNGGEVGATGAIWEVAIPVRVGCRIKSWSIAHEYDGGTHTLTGRLVKYTSGGVTTVATATSGVPGIGFVGAASFGSTLGTPDVVSAGETFAIEFTSDDGDADLIAHTVQWTFDRVP